MAGKEVPAISRDYRKSMMIRFLLPFLLALSLPLTNFLEGVPLAAMVENTALSVAVLLSFTALILGITKPDNRALENLFPVLLLVCIGGAFAYAIEKNLPAVSLHAFMGVGLIFIWFVTQWKGALWVALAAVILLATGFIYLLKINGSTEGVLLSAAVLLGLNVLMGVVLRYRDTEKTPVSNKSETVVAKFNESTEVPKLDQPVMEVVPILPEHDQETGSDAESIFLKRAKNWAQTLKDLQKHLATIHDVDVMFNRMLSFLDNIVPFEGAAVGMIQDRALKVTQFFGPDELNRENVLSWDTALVKKLAESKTGVADYQMYADLYGKRQTVERMDVPIISNDKMVGVVTLFRQPVPFNEYEIEIASSVVFHSMIVLRSARLYEEVRRLSRVGQQNTLFSREQFVEASNKEMANLSRPRSLSLLIVEIDQFEEVTNEYGRNIAETLFNALSDVIMGSFRSNDVLGRYGHDGYIILLHDTDLLQAQKLAERLRVKISKTTCKTSSGKISTTVSIGVAAATHEKDNISTLMHRADMALFVAKESGRDTVKVKL